MANIQQLKRRIKTAQNVSKTTKAMQMIAASKLKRAQNTAVSGKPYVEKITMLTQGLVVKLEETKYHPYMKNQKSEKTLLIGIAPDRGLCGGLVTNLLKEYLSFQIENISLIAIGKKMERFTMLKNEIIASFPLGSSMPSFEMVYPITKLIDEYYLSGKVGMVKILYSSFISIFTQKPSVVNLLPIVLEENEHMKEASKKLEFSHFEPKPENMLPPLLKRYLESTIYQYILEGFVSEQAARMLAMQNATDNAKDIIQQVSLEYNKARQAKITSEILDITGAALALEN